MIHIVKIFIKNFRPYYGVQEFDFGLSDGLSIILGDNGIGKSSIIKAFKFVLYDEFDSIGDFKIKNELNIVAFEEQNYEMYVALSFIFNNDSYLLKRYRRIKASIQGIPKSDNDFEGNVTLIKNDKILSVVETEEVLKNIIPKKISEYILFEGETINKYKDLLDNNKNQEIYDSIRKILGITILENSRNDLEKQKEKYNTEKIKMLRELTKNQKLLDELNKYEEQLIQYKSEMEQARSNLDSTRKRKQEYEEILKNNRRTQDLISKNYSYNESLASVNIKIDSLKEKIKNNLKQYKSFCYDFILMGNTGIPDKIKQIKAKEESNNILTTEIILLKDLLSSPACIYCGQAIHESVSNEIEEKIVRKERDIQLITPDQLNEVTEYDQRSDTLSKMISEMQHGFYEEEIQDFEAEIQTKQIEKDKYINLIKSIKNQIEDLGGTSNIEQVGKSYGMESRNEVIYLDTINKCEEKIRELQNSINDIEKKNPVNIDTSAISTKIETIEILIKIFDDSIEEFSNAMRIKVQEDATDLFKQISENQDYDRLQFDEQYGLKLIDKNGWIVPNISSGYMTLITISLIYGLHKNSSLTGTIILDAPFSVLTNFHRDNIINAFQTLSPQVILLVYRDQIDLTDLRAEMEGRLINEYVIFQDRNEENSSYKTKVGRTSLWQN